MEKRILIAFLLLLIAFEVYPQTEISESNQMLLDRMARQAKRGKSLFAKRQAPVVVEGEFISGDNKEDKRLSNLSSEELEKELSRINEKIEDLTETQTSHHSEEEERIAFLKKQKKLKSSLFYKVVNYVDHRQDYKIAMVCDSILDLKVLSDEVKSVASLIAEYAYTYNNVPYEDLGADKVVIRQFVTFINDPSYHPSNNYYCKVWDNRFIYCYSGERFDLDEPKDLTLVDFTHRYHPPLDLYTGSRAGGAVSRGYYDRRKWNARTKRLIADKDYIHGGVDLRFNQGETPNIYAVFDGVVRYAGVNGSLNSGFGNLIVIRHYNGTETSYAHLGRIDVKVNDKVTAGDIIGLGGSTGHGTAAHLDFKISVRGRFFDPEAIINFANNPKYDNGGAELGQLFAREIRVWMVKDSPRHNYKQHNVQILDLLKDRGLRESYIVYNPKYSGLNHLGSAMIPANP